MFLVDTSVWIDHFRTGVDRLADRLDRGLIASHPFVVGELACGNFRNRIEVLGLMAALPAAAVAEHAEVMQLITERQLHGSGLGWIDAHLLASAMLTGCGLWTMDKALARAARTIGIESGPRS